LKGDAGATMTIHRDGPPTLPLGAGTPRPTAPPTAHPPAEAQRAKGHAPALHAFGNRVIVMKDGVVVEAGEREDIFERPQAAYTKALLAEAFEMEVREGATVAG
jgi:hypothetical protein